jgi:outer membrane protein
MKRLCILLLLYVPFPCLAQKEPLSLRQAVETALRNNHSILIAENNKQIAENNNSAGNAGMLPNVNLVAGDNISVTNTRQQFFNGQTIEREDAQSNNFNTSVQLNWTVFDGLRMFIAKERLSQLEAQGELQAKAAVSNTISSVILAYSDLVRQKEQLKALQEAIRLSSERRFIAEQKLAIGAGSEYELLRATADLNTDSSAYIMQLSRVNLSKTQLEQLLSMDDAAKFSIDSVIPVSSALPPLDQLIQRVLHYNQDLLLASSAIQVSKLRIREIKAGRFPSVSLNTAYQYTFQESEAGLLQSSRNYGLTYGLNLTFPLFNGFSLSRSQKNTTLELKNLELQKDETELELRNNTERLYEEYQNVLKLIKIGKENIRIAEQNVFISLEKYRIGSISATELRDVQKILTDTRTLLLDHLFIAKGIETELLRISDQLVY